MTLRRFQSWPPPSDACRTVVVRIPPAQIGYASAILEGYEGIVTVRTRDRLNGVVDLWVMPGSEETLQSILEEFNREFPVLRIREESGHPDLHLESIESETL